jgi:hypothetical protein
MKFKSTLTALVLIAVVFSPASTALAIEGTFESLTRAFVSKEVGPNWRRGYSTALRLYCADVAAKVPRNTPNEDLWVQKEMMDSVSDASQQRQNRLENSKEYSRYIVRNTLDKCVELSDKILQVRNNIKEEAALWADLSWQLSASEDFKRSARILELYSATNDPAGLEVFQTIHQTILSKAIMPMLRE